MADELWIVDDDPSEAAMLKEALSRLGLTEYIRQYNSVNQAKEALQHRPGHFPIAVVSDLDTKDDLDDGAHFLQSIRKRAQDAGTGLWTILVSKHESKLDERVEEAEIPAWGHQYKDMAGAWAGKCAETLAPLFKSDLGCDKGWDDMCPPSVMRPTGGLCQGAVKDRIFVFSRGDVESSQAKQLFVECPSLNIPEKFQVSEPVLCYRGTMFKITHAAASVWLAQQLVRWRMACSKYASEYSAFHLAGASFDPEGKLNTAAFQSFAEEDVETSRDEPTGKLPNYSIGYGGYQNVTNDARRTPELKKLSSHLFGSEECWPILRKLPDQRTIKRNQKCSVPIPREMHDQTMDGFFQRAHFVLDDRNATALALWEKWVRSLNISCRE